MKRRENTACWIHTYTCTRTTACQLIMLACCLCYCLLWCFVGSCSGSCPNWEISARERGLAPVRIPVQGQGRVHSWLPLHCYGYSCACMLAHTTIVWLGSDFLLRMGRNLQGMGSLPTEAPGGSDVTCIIVHDCKRLRHIRQAVRIPTADRVPWWAYQ